MVRLLEIWDRLRESFWFIPTVLTALSLFVATGLLAVDRSVGAGLVTSGWFYTGGAEGARSLLSTVAGSIITVVALAFSITIVSLQLASAQFGPRLLRNFVRDRGNQVVLGVLVATFVYCLVVLRTVRGRDGLAEGAFVPHLAVTGAVVLAMVSVALLIFFIHHASKAIQADRVIAAVARDLDGAIDDLFPDPSGPEELVPDAAPPPRDDRGAAVPAPGEGYLTSIDGEAVVRAARAAGVTVHLTHRAGNFVIGGEPLAWVVPAARLEDGLARAIAGAHVLGRERTLLQDVLFGVEQLVEIAVRSLASGHADPTTALRCIDRLGAAVGRLSGRRMPSPCLRDADGTVRLVKWPVTLDEIVDAAFSAIRLQGTGNRSVALHLLRTFERLACLQDRQALHAALLGEAVRIQRAAEWALTDADDRAVVRAAFERFLRALRADVRGRYDALAPAA